MKSIKVILVCYKLNSDCDKLVVFDVLIPNPKKDKPDKFYYPLNHLNYQSCIHLLIELPEAYLDLADLARASGRIARVADM